MARGKLYTPEEDDIIREVFKQEKDQKLTLRLDLCVARLTGRSRESVRSRAESIGVHICSSVAAARKEKKDVAS